MAEDQPPQTPDNAVRAFIGLFVLGSVLEGFAALHHDEMLVAIGFFALGAILAIVDYFWKRIRARLGGRFAQTATNVATDFRWWVVCIIVVLALLGVPLLKRGYAPPSTSSAAPAGESAQVDPLEQPLPPNLVPDLKALRPADRDALETQINAIDKIIHENLITQVVSPLPIQKKGVDLRPAAAELEAAAANFETGLVSLTKIVSDSKYSSYSEQITFILGDEPSIGANDQFPQDLRSLQALLNAIQAVGGDNKTSFASGVALGEAEVGCSADIIDKWITERDIRIQEMRTSLAKVRRTTD